MRPGAPVELAPGVLAMVDAADHVLASAIADPRDLAAVSGLPGWRAAESLSSRMLLRRLLAGVCGPVAASAVITADRGGRPRLAGLPGIGVSMSHDGGLVAAAVADGLRVGVDVHVPAPVTAALIRRCCQPPVAARLTALPQRSRDAGFAAVWTVQEACVKAAGTGLAGRPWRIPVDFRARHGTWQGYRWRSWAGEDQLTPLAVAYGPVTTAGR